VVETSETGYVAIYIENLSIKEITVQFGYSIRNSKDEQVVYRQISKYFTFGPFYGRGFTDFAERSTLIDALVDGTLVVEVHMKSRAPSNATLPHFIPENPLCTNMIQMFNDEEYADIVFEVGEHQSKNNASKAAKITPVTFHAHRAY
jgi:hypothetical protein